MCSTSACHKMGISTLLWLVSFTCEKNEVCVLKPLGDVFYDAPFASLRIAHSAYVKTSVQFTIQWVWSRGQRQGALFSMFYSLCCELRAVTSSFLSWWFRFVWKYRTKHGSTELYPPLLMVTLDIINVRHGTTTHNQIVWHVFFILKFVF